MSVTSRLTLYRGTAPQLRFTFAITTDADGVTNDISGWTTRFVMRPKPESATVTLTKAGSVDSVEDQRFTVDLTKADTLALTVGTYAAAFERTDTGVEELLGRYLVTVERDIVNAD
jgi:hypothetical protein